MAMTKPHYAATKRNVIDEGGTCVIKPQGLNIVWGNDERYWKIPKEDDGKPAELLQVSWLEVTGSVEGLKTGKGYNLTFEVKLTADAFGWKDIQVFLMAKVGKKGKYKWKKVKLEQRQNDQGQNIASPDGIQLISIDVPNDTTDTNTLHFGLYEVWSGKWKGGLEIYKATVTEA